MSFVISSLRSALEASNGSQVSAQSVATTPAAVVVPSKGGITTDSALLFKSHIDALLPTQSPITQRTAPAGPASTIKLRELTLPFGSFASAVKSVQNGSGAPSVLPSGTPLKLGDLGNLPGQSADGLKLVGDRFGDAFGKGLNLPGGPVFGGDPENNPRADWGDGDGTGKTPVKPGPKGGGGDPGPDRLGFGGFIAHDIDLVVPHYRDPDLNPRADCGDSGCGTTSGGTDCGATGCGTTSGGTDCGATGCGTTSGGTDCGATGCGTTSGGTDCGATGCGTTSGGTDCGSTGCGTTSGGTDCGSTSCGSTDACGSTSGSRDYFDQISRVALLRDQLTVQLQFTNVSSKMIR